MFSGFHVGIEVCSSPEEDGGASQCNFVANKDWYPCGIPRTLHSASTPGKPKFFFELFLIEIQL